MLPLERQEAILEILNTEGSVVVKDLSRKFNVSKDSIRNDLTLLENQNKLVKTYGGAIQIRKNPHEKVAEKRISKHIPEKKIIANKALKIIEDNSIVYLDMSTANIYLAELIANSNLKLTVVTTMVKLIDILKYSSNIDLIVIGGSFNETKEGYVGSLTNSIMDSFEFDYSFIGTVGVDAVSNKIYTYEVEDGITKKTAINNSRNSYLLLETRKLLLNGNYVFDNFYSLSGIICEKELSEKQKQSFDRYKLDII